MNYNPGEIKTERYSSRYTRGFLKMLIDDGKEDIDKYIEQYYTSKNYQERLEAIKYLIGVSGKYSFPAKIFTDALKDYCSQVKVYVLKYYDFPGDDDPEIEDCLADIAKNDEKLQIRALALEKLAELNGNGYYDLFFSTSLLKSSKESAAGIKGLFKLNKEKAYQMAKFRADTSSGNLDLAIADIFQEVGDIEDLNFFKQRLRARSKFNKIELINIYLKMLGKTKIGAVLKNHIIFISNDIIATSNKELVQLLIMELHNFISVNHGFLNKNKELLQFLNNTIDLLLEKNYKSAKQTDPFGPI